MYTAVLYDFVCLLMQQVSNMVGYAVGETVDYTSTTSEDESREEGSGAVVERQQQSSHLNCYEVVTAWVHPRYGNYWISTIEKLSSVLSQL